MEKRYIVATPDGETIAELKTLQLAQVFVKAMQPDATKRKDWCITPVPVLGPMWQSNGKAIIAELQADYTAFEAKRMRDKVDHSADVAKRFPKGGKDTLGGNNSLGNNFRSVDGQEFKVNIARKSCKMFAAN